MSSLSPELKGHIKKKMQEINELKQMGDNQGEAQKRAKERAEEILQKYKKMTTISQNVFRVSALLCVVATLSFMPWTQPVNQT